MQGAENTEKQKLSAPLRARMWKYRMISVIVCALAVWIASKGNWNKIPLSVATVVLIIGVAIWMLASPDDYNGSTDIWIVQERLKNFMRPTKMSVRRLAPVILFSFTR